MTSGGRLGACVGCWCDKLTCSCVGLVAHVSDTLSNLHVILLLLPCGVYGSQGKHAPREAGLREKGSQKRKVGVVSNVC